MTPAQLQENARLALEAVKHLGVAEQWAALQSAADTTKTLLEAQSREIALRSLTRR